ncbi:glycoside hydrolase family 65 [Cohnella cellulosilytica]|uniref:Glycoside hydrolase family 65 n=1 Tax=Cohnella cellulosilytica TaxID=986710 RepID=A0ABW2FMT2_9BACL
MPIDRLALVRRHNPVVDRFDPGASLTVGNGDYAFTVDATGLQTFPALYENGGVPLGHLSNWGWHTFPNPEGYRMETFKPTHFRTFNGRSVGFPYAPRGAERTAEYDWLQANPHRLHLGRVGFRLRLPDGGEAAAAHLTDIRQTLDLWTGVIVSRFSVGGRRTTVRTCCHPESDLIAVRIRSELIGAGALQIAFRFPYGSGSFSAPPEWQRPEAHTTELADISPRAALLRRTLDSTAYEMAVAFSGGAFARGSSDDPHLFLLTPESGDWENGGAGGREGGADPDSEDGGEHFEFVFRTASSGAGGALPGYAETEAASARYWEAFWRGGAALELAGSADPRAFELERRVVLSQYLTAVQSSGKLPPQESGLTHNSWYGKFHLEMHWWHAVHFALWGRTELLENSLVWYMDIMPQARALAAAQGYEGARWPKCVGPDGVNGPCYIEPFLIWQQPHPIYYAELAYRSGGRSALERYGELVFATADFMASFAEWDERGRRYVLGPPVAPAQEIYDHGSTVNPTFELSYWAFGLTVALAWRERLGLPPVDKWTQVAAALAELPTTDGLYAAAETAPDTFRDETGADLIDHPTMLAPLGMLPGGQADPETMRRTLHEVMRRWTWDHTWGWDYPLTAMTAARLGEGNLAVDALLMERGKNTYLPNGHNYQRPDLSVYLPGNGGLLTAVAMMAGGWDNGPDAHAPGFPQDGSWNVRSEGFLRML